MRRLAAFASSLATALGALGALSVASCYSPEIPSGKFSCKVDGDCPGALICRNVSGKGQRCIDPEPATDQEDMATAGLEGCRGDGVKLSDTVFACRGSFSPGRNTCAGGYRLCGDNDSEKLQQIVPQCAGLSGFFLADRFVGELKDGDNSTYDVNCGRLSGPFGWQGCGTDDKVRQTGRRQGSCLPVTTVMPCDGSRLNCQPFVTPGHDGKGSGGALCCKG